MSNRWQQIQASRLLLSEIDRLATGGADFAFESTLSGVGYVSRLEEWKRRGYRIEIVYLSLRSPEIALRRIETRVRQGGHGIPKTDVLRRFPRSWSNFQRLYRPIADAWMVYDNSEDRPELVDKGP